MVGQLPVGLAGPHLDVRDELHVPAALAVVPLDEVASGLEDRVDAVLLGQREGLEDLLVGRVGAEEVVDVLQVAGVHVARDQVAAQQDPADLRLADRAAGKPGAGLGSGPAAPEAIIPHPPATASDWLRKSRRLTDCDGSMASSAPIKAWASDDRTDTTPVYHDGIGMRDSRDDRSRLALAWLGERATARLEYSESRSRVPAPSPRPVDSIQK